MTLVELQRALRLLRCSGMAAGLEHRILQAQAEKLAASSAKRRWNSRSVRGKSGLGMGRIPFHSPSSLPVPLSRLQAALLNHSASPVGNHPASTVCLGVFLGAASPERNPQSRDRAAGASSRTLVGEP
jgi:hypothetical protein